MSGGVDSSVAAFLLREAGYRCGGGIMRLFDGALHGGRDIDDAGSVADLLGIPLHVLDMQEDFRESVILPFIRAYELGLTPNPCLFCNRRLKFGRFLEKAQELGYDGIATGHFARIRKDPDTGRYGLFRAADPGKDQSYFLYSLTQEQMAHTLFPLGDLDKSRVREIAADRGLVNAKKQDSQDICFVPDGDYASFIRQYTGKSYPPGDYLDLQGNKVGIHAGAICYTVGQRKGLGIALGEPVYVCGKDMERNTVTVGRESALFARSLIAGDWNFIPFDRLESPMEVTAKIRYRHKEQPAVACPRQDGTVEVTFQEPQRAITPGQAVVLYSGDRVIGGGTIAQVCE